MSTLLWVIFPYVCLTIFAVGHWWRYHYDKFGWTTRSSQLYESKLMRWGSPLFHFGILFVILGHVGGLLIPKSWTEAVGIDEQVYHLTAIITGLIAGLATVVGLAILIYRRRTVGSVFSVTTKMDKLMYVVLGVVILLGMANTVWGNIVYTHDYRMDVSVWFRQIFYLSPRAELMDGAPLSFQLHAIAAFALFALWPFTRLVHAFSAPVGYLWRPYIVYRSKDAERLGSAATRPGWEPPELKQSQTRRSRKTASRR